MGILTYTQFLVEYIPYIATFWVFDVNLPFDLGLITSLVLMLVFENSWNKILFADFKNGNLQVFDKKGRSLLNRFLDKWVQLSNW
jgi:hypothetical protein